MNSFAQFWTHRRLPGKQQYQYRYFQSDQQIFRLYGRWARDIWHTKIDLEHFRSQLSTLPVKNYLNISLILLWFTWFWTVRTLRIIETIVLNAHYYFHDVIFTSSTPHREIKLVSFSCTLSFYLWRNTVWMTGEVARWISGVIRKIWRPATAFFGDC